MYRLDTIRATIQLEYKVLKLKVEYSNTEGDTGANCQHFQLGTEQQQQQD